jgi:hypothetical protein
VISNENRASVVSGGGAALSPPAVQLLCNYFVYAYYMSVIISPCGPLK